MRLHVTSASTQSDLFHTRQSARLDSEFGLKITSAFAPANISLLEMLSASPNPAAGTSSTSPRSLIPSAKRSDKRVSLGFSVPVESQAASPNGGSPEAAGTPASLTTPRSPSPRPKEPYSASISPRSPSTARHSFSSRAYPPRNSPPSKPSGFGFPTIGVPIYNWDDEPDTYLEEEEVRYLTPTKDRAPQLFGEEPLEETLLEDISGGDLEPMMEVLESPKAPTENTPQVITVPAVDESMEHDLVDTMENDASPAEPIPNASEAPAEQPKPHVAHDLPQRQATGGLVGSYDDILGTPKGGPKWKIGMSIRQSPHESPLKHQLPPCQPLPSDFSSEICASNSMNPQPRTVSEPKLGSALQNSVSSSSSSASNDYFANLGRLSQSQSTPSKNNSRDNVAIDEFDPFRPPAASDWFMKFDSPQQNTQMTNVSRAMHTPMQASTGSSNPMSPPPSLLDAMIEPPTPTSMPKYTERDVQQTKLTMQGEFQRELDLVQSEMNVIEQRRAAAVEGHELAVKTLAEYDKIMKSMLVEKELEKQRTAMEMNRLESQIENMREDKKRLQNENAHLAHKWKESRVFVEDLKENGARLYDMMENLKAEVVRANERFEGLKKHAESKLEEANTEMTRIRAAYDKEVSALKAKLSRSEVQMSTLERTIESKTQENQELTKICDSLVAQLEERA
ncbi:transforming acidic coiled-coil-containing protein-domain containing protein [Phlyctochytrium arcticum]|nr:transforming acidic coiled-coil-containing protein-domain containing protein [Phlyctochytrium arcticum]